MAAPAFRVVKSGSKRRRAHGAEPAKPHASRPGRSRLRGRRALLILSIVALAAAGGYALFRPRDPARPTAGVTGEVVDVNALIPRIRELTRQNKSLEALPLARQVVAQNGEYWQSHFLLAVTMASALHEERSVFGRNLPVTRSSRERVALVRQALDELAEAERLSQSPNDLVHVRSSLGQILAVWGLDWNALVEYSELDRLDPNWRDKVTYKEDYRSVLARLRLADVRRASR